MNLKQLLVILLCISLLPSFAVALTETFGEVVNLRTIPLKVRTGPGVEYEKISELPLGHIVKILQTHGSWYEVEYHDKFTGFSFAKYIRILPQHGYDGYVQVVAHKWLNVRSGPSYHDFPEIYRVAEHSILKTLSEVAFSADILWFRVEDRNGMVGYVNGSSKYIKPLYGEYYELAAFKSYVLPEQTLRTQSRPQLSEKLSEDEQMLNRCLEDIKKSRRGCISVCSKHSETSEELQECKIDCKEALKGSKTDCFEEYKEYKSLAR